MKRPIATALAVVAFAATGVVLACEYAPMNDAAAAVPADVSKMPVVLACEGAGCSAVPAKPLITPKSAKKAVVVAKGPAATPSSTIR